MSDKLIDQLLTVRRARPVQITPEKTALLVVDMQERLMAAMPEQVAMKVLRNTRILVETAREFNLPVLASEHSGYRVRECPEAGTGRNRGG